MRQLQLAVINFFYFQEPKSTSLGVFTEASIKRIINGLIYFDMFEKIKDL